ncbi:MAG: hypothetical protein M1820_004184 [Bogoriella megaspora]|nr:MAG: hypothetical protein M1820_004184 [Bogoriella megaspora]
MHTREAPGFSPGGQFIYGPPGSSGYSVPDIVYGDPNNRKIRVLTIGAGVSGILMAYKIQKEMRNVDHVIYEKNAEIGGTWLENRYPGCACDIPSAAYAFNFALNPDWPRFFSYAPDIQKYLLRVVETFGLRKYMTFNTEIVGCYWQEEKGKWKVKLRDTISGDEKEEECDVLLHAAGLLNNYKWPKISGIENFKGRIVHTAHWPSDYQAEQWKQDSVAVIGSGASSIQTVPNMQPHVKHMDIFIRTGVWFVQIAGNGGDNRSYTAEQRATFRKDPDALVAEAKFIEDKVNGLWGGFYENTQAQARAQELMTERTKQFIKDERLLKGFAPKFGLGCRRITPGDPYMAAIQKENVDVHFTHAESITEKGVVGGDGVEREIDTIVCATGFDVTYRPRFELVGEGGVDLKEKWKVTPESYLSVCVPGFPNMIQFIGPTFPVENGSVIGALGAVADYTLEWIRKMQREGLKSWAPRQDITDMFNDHTQEWITHTVWKSSCRSWYKNNDTGRVNAVWPGATLHFNNVLANPRWQDFEISYIYKNPWAALGMGWTTEWTEDKDKSPYLTREHLDPLWIETIAKGDSIEGEEGVKEEIAVEEKKVEPKEEEKSDEKKEEAVGGPKGEEVGAEVVNGVTGEGTKVEQVVTGHDAVL